MPNIKESIHSDKKYMLCVTEDLCAFNNITYVFYCLGSVIFNLNLQKEQDALCQVNIQYTRPRSPFPDRQAW